MIKSKEIVKVTQNLNTPLTPRYDIFTVSIYCRKSYGITTSVCLIFIYFLYCSINLYLLGEWGVVGGGGWGVVLVPLIILTSIQCGV